MVRQAYLFLHLSLALNDPFPVIVLVAMEVPESDVDLVGTGESVTGPTTKTMAMWRTTSHGTL